MFVLQEEFSVDEDISMLDCGHDHHANCISQWLVLNNSCPICTKRFGCFTRIMSSPLIQRPTVDIQRSERLMNTISSSSQQLNSLTPCISSSNSSSIRSSRAVLLYLHFQLTTVVAQIIDKRMIKQLMQDSQSVLCPSFLPLYDSKDEAWLWNSFMRNANQQKGQSCHKLQLTVQLKHKSCKITVKLPFCFSNPLLGSKLTVNNAERCRPVQTFSYSTMHSSSG
ncbi:hypothetical protein ACOSQ4_004029 [Xanthoceras sorbifolium]